MGIVSNRGRSVIQRDPMGPNYSQAPVLGGWADSAFYCTFAQITGGNLANSVFLQTPGTAAGIPVALFTSDVPALVMCESVYPTWQVADSAMEAFTLPAGLKFLEEFQLIGNVDATPITTVPGIIRSAAPATITPSDVNSGQIVNGFTTTGNIEINAFFGRVNLVDRNILATIGGAEATPSLRMECLANGAVIQGQPSSGAFSAYDGAGTAGTFPDRCTVLLRESDYTAAIAEGVSGDLPNTGTDGNGVRFRVVGLFAIPAA